MIHDAGAAATLDFTDLGHVSTYRIPLEQIEPLCGALIAHLQRAGVEAIVLLIGLVFNSLRDLARAWDQRTGFEEGRRRILAVLRQPSGTIGRPAQALPGNGPIGLRLEGVRVEVNQAAWCFQAEPGERVRVCGAAASGKSTPLRVAAGLIAPVTGRVLLEGLPLETIKDLHRVVQLVSSDVPLVRGTVGENLQMARISDSGPVAEALAKALGIESGTSLFPDGLETPVGDGGSQLSSGARARVSLGRALMAQPRLLLIDDPAFMLDRENERILHRALSLTRAMVLRVGGPGAGDNAREQIWNLSPLEQILRWETDSAVEPALTA